METVKNDMINITKYMVWWIITHNVVEEYRLKAAEVAQIMVRQGYKSEIIEKEFKRLGYLKEPTKSWDVATRHHFTDPTIRIKEERHVFKNAHYYVCGILLVLIGIYFCSSYGISRDWNPNTLYNKILNRITWNVK